jgi:hypothetical protein
MSLARVPAPPEPSPVRDTDGNVGGPQMPDVGNCGANAGCPTSSRLAGMSVAQTRCPTPPSFGGAGSSMSGQPPAGNPELHDVGNCGADAA